MKKSTVVIVAVALVMGLTSFSYAKYVTGFKVVEVLEDQVTIQKGDGDPVKVTVKKAKKYKVGDKVKYNEEKLKIRQTKVKKALMGC